MNRLRYLKASDSGRPAGGLHNTVRTIRATYETDPQVYAAMLPRPLDPIDRPEIKIQLAHVAMHYSPERTVEIGALTMSVMCSFEGQPGAYCFHMAMEGETVVTGGREFKSVILKPEVVNPEDVEMLQDLLLAAFNDALSQAKRLEEEQMSSLTGGLGLPPGLF